MKINITAGDCLNKILENKYPNERFIPFREAMINGSYTAKLFSEEFIEERAATHDISDKKYKENLQAFLTFLQDVKKYELIILWFGDEPFCNANKKTVLQTLKEYNYQGKIILNTVIEESGKILKTQSLLSLPNYD